MTSNPPWLHVCHYSNYGPKVVGVIDLEMPPGYVCALLNLTLQIRPRSLSAEFYWTDCISEAVYEPLGIRTPEQGQQ